MTRVISLIAVVILCGSCSAPQNRVVVYTALDEMYAEPVLQLFEERTGIEAVPVYDTEAAKTTGLVNRLMAERDRPRADVFWNNEVAQTIRLTQDGALAAYDSPGRAGIPEKFKDAEGYWTGFAARARVIIYNTELVEDPPVSVRDLLDPKWKGQAAIAKPLFGTTATHAAAWFALWGDGDTKAFFEGIKANEIAVLAGNSTVRDLVARGEFAWGLTDTDDANGGVLDGFPVTWLFPDQGADGTGTLLIPNTVALVKGGPNGDAGRKLIDFLLSPEVERMLAESRSLQIPLNPEVETPEGVPTLRGIQTMDVSFEAIADSLPVSMAYVQESFLR